MWSCYTKGRFRLIERKPRRELKRYEHFSSAVQKQTVDLIASELEVVSDLPTGTPDELWHVSVRLTY